MSMGSGIEADAARAGDHGGWNADVTPEAVAHMRRLAAPVMDAQEWESTTAPKQNQPDQES